MHWKCIDGVRADAIPDVAPALERQDGLSHDLCEYRTDVVCGQMINLFDARHHVSG
jgi:hypothetical protein